MSDLAEFQITKRWPAQHSDRIQLYSLPTPNGVKASIVLEELGLAYEPHLVSFGNGNQNTPEFLSLNPNNKIPAIIDPDGPGGRPLALCESGAFLIYLAEKTGKLLPSDPAARIECIQWLMFQMGGIGPMVGQLGHFYKFAADKITDPDPTERYIAETKRLLNVLDGRLEGRDYIMGDDYTIADIATFPWIRVIGGFYGAAEVVGVADFANVVAYVRRCEARPAGGKRADPAAPGLTVERAGAVSRIHRRSGGGRGATVASRPWAESRWGWRRIYWNFLE